MKLARLYARLRAFREWHEHWEIWINSGELLVAGFAVGRFAIEVTTAGLSWEATPAIAEFFIFLVLFFSILARLALVVRDRNRGPDFGTLLPEGSDAKSQALFKELSHFMPAQGFLGSVIGEQPEVRAKILEAIAVESSSVFSMRTYAEADLQWKSWEERYLANWLSQFPALIWRVPPDDHFAPPVSGYYSIIVPITEDAWNKVRNGHMSTAVASLDERAVGYWAIRTSQPFNLALHLLAYSVIYVPTGKKWDRSNHLKLLYTGIEHLAYLVQQFCPPPGGVKSATLSLVSESPNRTLGTIFSQLGLSPVKNEDPHDLENTRVIKSPAGFRVYEIAYAAGKPKIGNPERAATFLGLLYTIAERGAAKAAPVHASMTLGEAVSHHAQKS